MDDVISEGLYLGQLDGTIVPLEAHYTVVFISFDRPIVLQANTFPPSSEKELPARIFFIAGSRIAADSSL